MRIAILGIRGIPSSYGGFETFAEELATRLVERGHQVTVYCRQRHTAEEYRGVRLVYLPTIRHKYFDTLAHTAIATLHLVARGLVQRYDVVLYCNAANAIFTWLPRPLGMPTLLNVDGLERLRKKWNILAKKWYHLSEWLATFCPTHPVSDAAAIRDYYWTTYRTRTTFIPYGAPAEKCPTQAVLERLQLQPGQYFLYVTRFEPENNPHLVREAFEQVETPMQLALIGDAPYAHEYIQRVKNTTDPRVHIPGAIYGTGYHELQSHCFAYVHATEVGGTHPALIEAMGRGALILYLRTTENEEVAGGCGLPFTAETLPAVMRQALALPEEERNRLRQAAQARVREKYSWDAVTTAYEKLFAEYARGV